MLNISRIENYPAFHANLLAMTWSFYIAPADSFFVSSNSPAVYEHLPHGEHILIFPIAYNLVLIAKSTGSSDLNYVEASPEEAFAMNFMFIRMTSAAADPELYAPKAEKWVWGTFNHSLGLDEDQQRAWRQLVG